MEVQPRTKPKPGPKTRPASISKKNTVSMPFVPAPRGRSAALTALSTPRIASALASMPASEICASTRSMSIGSRTMKMNGVLSVTAVEDGTIRGQAYIATPAILSKPSMRVDFQPKGTG